MHQHSRMHALSPLDIAPARPQIAFALLAQLPRSARCPHSLRRRGTRAGEASTRPGRLVTVLPHAMARRQRAPSLLPVRGSGPSRCAAPWLARLLARSTTEGSASIGAPVWGERTRPVDAAALGADRRVALPHVVAKDTTSTAVPPTGAGQPHQYGLARRRSSLVLVTNRDPLVATVGPWQSRPRPPSPQRTLAPQGSPTLSAHMALHGAMRAGSLQRVLHAEVCQAVINSPPARTQYVRPARTPTRRDYGDNCVACSPTADRLAVGEGATRSRLVWPGKVITPAPPPPGPQAGHSPLAAGINRMFWRWR
jgi:hypothetical protein